MIAVTVRTVSGRTLGASRWIGRPSGGSVHVIPVLANRIVAAVEVGALDGHGTNVRTGMAAIRTIHLVSPIDKYVFGLKISLGGAMVVVIDVLNPDLNDTAPQPREAKKERDEVEARNNARRTRLQVISITGELVDVEV